MIFVGGTVIATPLLTSKIVRGALSLRSKDTSTTSRY